MDSNITDDVVINEPKDARQRHGVAQSCCRNLKLNMPCVVDTMENTVDNQYAGWPERLFVIQADGRISYAARPGPWGFKPKEAEEALRKLLR